VRRHDAGTAGLRLGPTIDPAVTRRGQRMEFNTPQFAYFMAILFPLYWFIPHRWQNRLILAASYYFYGCWDWRFLTLLIISTVMDFACGLALDRIEQPRKRKMFVALSMALNLGMLGTFKYYNFFADSVQTALAGMGLNVPLSHLEVVLPLGISFYTFQSMSYVIDVYRKDIKPTRNLLEFAAFVSFFPHLVAGPIMRPTTLLPQIEHKRKFNLDQFYQGAYLIFWGLTKKVVIADNLADYVNDIFNQWQTVDGGLALLGVYAFAFQIYCDFSGYTDVARGVAKTLGFELSLNFNLPYFSTSPREFWSRWHISLSTWLRDYLYIPLGGSRGSKWMLYRNLMLTMIIGGLWHGAAWTFVVWGFYHGALLVIHRLLSPYLKRIEPRNGLDAACWKVFRILVTFHLICLGWLIFRATSLTQVWGMLDAIATRFAVPATSVLLPVSLCILPLVLYQLLQYLTRDLDIISKTPWFVRSAFYTSCFYAFVLGGNFSGGQFIYFQF
jgi:D-alanyl-lipoteichoic acid acyltransferase DltB (MBOAT superfamily)